jgi:hypothetical protein
MFMGKFLYLFLCEQSALVDYVSCISNSKLTMGVYGSLEYDIVENCIYMLFTS